MKIVVIAAGRLKERELRVVADDYLGRIRRYAKCDEVEVRSSKELAAAVPEGATLVALEVAGDALSSTQLSQRVERWGSTGKGVVAFIIGDADGIPQALSLSATARLSLSSLTFPHRLARILLLEQLYRSFSILRGEPYARE